MLLAGGPRPASPSETPLGCSPAPEKPPEEKANADRDPGPDAEFWSKKMPEVEVERSGYHRLAARGHMSDEELTTALSDLHEGRETAERQLEAARAREESLRRLEHDRDALMESYAGTIGGP